MTDQQWDAIQESLAGFSVQDKLELIDRLRQSIGEDASDAELGQRQREAIRQVREILDSMPTTGPDDGLSNRDHDRILYSR